MSEIIQIDDAGWGDLLLGVVIGAYELPSKTYHKSFIPVFYFQEPRWSKKTYLNASLRCLNFILSECSYNKDTRFEVCRGYILSLIRQELRKTYRVFDVVVTDPRQSLVEATYREWCTQIGFNGMHDDKRSRNFMQQLDFVRRDFFRMEKYVKTGWSSWNLKWKDSIHPNTPQMSLK